MLFEYDVERAKELLADAGYPDGFQTEVLCDSTDADELSIIKSYLEDINITLDLNIVEATNKTARVNAREYRMAFNTLGIWAPFEMLTTKYGQVQCTRNTDDPFYKDIQICVASNILSNPDAYIQCMKESAEYELASAWAIFTPRPWQYTYWWPWVKDYNGIYWTGWAGVWDWTKSIWVDQELKETMGY
jgi:peptide/nickel transport system substrate-binding protein